MRRQGLAVTFLALLLAVGATSGARAELQTEAATNRVRCLTGFYPNGCDHAALSAEDKITADREERRVNRQSCASASYSMRCNPALLSVAEQQTLEKTRYAENLQSCLRGLYPALCDHDRLAAGDRAAVAKAEAAVAAGTRR